MKGKISLLGFFLLSACASSERVYVSVNELKSDIVFVVTTNDSENSLKIITETARAPKDFTTRPLVELQLNPTQEIPQIIGIDQNQLQKLAPSYDQSQLSEIQLRLKQVDVQSSLEFDVIDLSTNMEFWEFDFSKNALVTADEKKKLNLIERLELVIPRDFDACRDVQNEVFRPIAFPDADNCSRSFREVERIDQTRFLAVGNNYAQIIEFDSPMDCGQPGDGSSQSRGTVIDLPSNQGNFALGSTPLDDGSYLFVNIRNDPANDEPLRFHIEERRIYPQGFGPITYSQTLEASEVPNLTNSESVFATDVTIDENNVAYILFLKGIILTKDRNEQTYQQQRLGAFADNTRATKLWLFRAGPNTASPHLVSSEGLLYYGDLFANEWQKINIESLEALVNPWDIMFGTPENKLGEFTFVANNGLQGWVAQWNEEQIIEIPIRYPKRLSGCFIQQRLSNIRKIEADDKAIYVVPDCNTIARIRHSDQCVSFLNIEADPSYEVTSRPPLKDILLNGNQLIAAGLDGRIYSIDVSSYEE